MKTKDLVLNVLKEHGSEFISGQQIADDLYISRAAVWKAIKALGESGYTIEAVRNKGYRIIEDISLPDGHAIKNELNTTYRHPQILVYDEVDSTNNIAKKYFESERKHEAVILAGSQTCGRGRRGRSFFSPGKTGMYMSFLLHPQVEISGATKLTCMMAEAVCRAIKDVTGKETCIKWVNDIFYDGKKIAGILTEGETSIEDGTLAYVVIGVGINLYMPYEGFPEDIKNTAGALLNTGFDAAKRNSLYAAIINRFYELYNAHDADVFVEDYKRRSFLIGKYVKIMQHSARSRRGRDYAEVIGIDDECRLLVKYEDGTTEALMSGEVSVVRY